jgi:hypothetical protein
MKMMAMMDGPKKDKGMMMMKSKKIVLQKEVTL